MQCSVALFGLSSSAHRVGGKGDYPLDYPGGADTADRCPYFTYTPYLLQYTVLLCVRQDSLSMIHTMPTHV